MKLLELIQVTTHYFQKQGIDSARLNTEQLIAFGLGIKRLDLYLQFDRDIAENNLEKLRVLVKRRANREPLQHILGTTEFFGYTFKSDSRALVPRPETEGLVELALSKVDNEPGILWDVGTGSGVIAISFLRQKPGWKAIASDISSEALTLAQENALHLKVEDRIQFVQADLFQEGLESVDMIISNPPYLPTETLSTLSPEVQFDPKLALDGGKDGITIIERLMKEALAYLKSGGWIFLEIGENQTESMLELGRKIGFIKPLVYKDLNDRPRYFVANK